MFHIATLVQTQKSIGTHGELGLLLAELHKAQQQFSVPRAAQAASSSSTHAAHGGLPSSALCNLLPTHRQQMLMACTQSRHPPLPRQCLPRLLSLCAVTQQLHVHRDMPLQMHLSAPAEPASSASQAPSTSAAQTSSSSANASHGAPAEPASSASQAPSTSAAQTQSSSSAHASHGAHAEPASSAGQAPSSSTGTNKRKILEKEVTTSKRKKMERCYRCRHSLPGMAASVKKGYKYLPKYGDKLYAGVGKGLYKRAAT